MSKLIQKVHCDKVPAAVGPYSQAMIYNQTLYASGQVPINPASGKIEVSDIQGQTQQTIKNIDELLKSLGLSAENVIKTTCFLADMDDFAAFNEIYGEYFSSKPARSTVAVKSLPLGALVEIEIIASME